MPRIPSAQIEHLKQTADLVAIIKDRGVKLRKTGNLYKEKFEEKFVKSS
jgi:DNA primase